MIVVAAQAIRSLLHTQQCVVGDPESGKVEVLGNMEHAVMSGLLSLV